MPDIKSWGIVAVLLAIIAASVFGGQELGYWRASAGYATKVEEFNKQAKQQTDQILGLSGQNATLLLGIAANNKAVAVAEAKTESAEAARVQAQKHADDMAALSDSRLAKIDKALKDAKTVGEVLSRYWEIRQ